MKARLVKVKNKGICILISDINPLQLWKASGMESETEYMINPDSPFNDPDAIALEMKRGRKIQCIKEIRAQTGWGLKDAKDFSDNYEFGDNDAGRNSAERFLKKYKAIPLAEFLDFGEMEIL